MNKKHLNCLTASEFLSALSSRKLKVEDYVLACIKQIKKKNKDFSAWEYFNAKKLITEAQIKDQYLDYWLKTNKNINHFYKEVKKDIPLKNKFILPYRLFGVPIGIKDIFNTEDMPTKFGSSIYKNFHAGNDARVVTHLKREGALNAGKTVTAEFAVHNPGKTKNPLNINLSPGTSSSGSATAVALNMIPIAISSQTAGSTIRPASYCGIYGFKPSYGTLARTGMLKTTDTLDSVGIMSRSIEDLRLSFDVMRVRGPNYPLVYKNYTKNIEINNKHYNFLHIKGYCDKYISKEANDNFNKFLYSLKQNKNVTIDTLELPNEFSICHTLHEMIYCKSLSYYFKEEWNSNEKKFSKVLSKMIIKGLSITKTQYFDALNKQEKLRLKFNKLYDKYDASLCLSANDDAPKYKNIIDTPDYNLLFTMFHNPVISLPLLKGSKNLPLGLQIASSKYSDYNLLKIAEYIISKNIKLNGI